MEGCIRDYVDEPNFISYPRKHTHWDAAISKCSLQTRSPEEAKHFGIRSTGMKTDPSSSDTPAKDKAESASPKAKSKIGGEYYDIRELLIHSAHRRLTHYSTSKTYRDLARDTFWPGQWTETLRPAQRCDMPAEQATNSEASGSFFWFSLVFSSCTLALFSVLFLLIFNVWWRGF